MELHELESAWKALDQRVSRQAEEIAHGRAQARGLRSRWRLHLVTLGQVVQIGIGLLFALWGGGYWFDHLGTPHLVVYGVAVHAYGIALLGTAIALIVRLARVDYGAPVAEVQQALLDLRRTRIVTERILWCLGAIAWVPLLMMALQAIRIDAWRHAPAFVWMNVAIGVGVALCAAIVMWRKPAWFARNSMGGGLRDVDRQLEALRTLRP